jgi:hypothetical protein
MENMTNFTNKCEILGQFYSQYREIKDFADFMEFNDLGLPLAYFISENLVEVSDDGARYISETWDLFIASLEIEDTGFETLEDVFFAAGQSQK